MIAANVPPDRTAPGDSILREHESFSIQVCLTIKCVNTLTIRISILLATQETQIRDGRRVDKVTQVAQDHPGTVDVARLELFHRLDHRQRHFVVVCTMNNQLV